MSSRPAPRWSSRPERRAASRSGEISWTNVLSLTALLLSLALPAPTRAQTQADPRVLGSDPFRWGRATVRVTAHATYGVLVQVEAPDAGILAFILAPGNADAWTRIASASLDSARGDSAIALAPLGDRAGAISAHFMSHRGGAFLAFVARDELVHRQIAIEVTRKELTDFVLAVYDAASTVGERWRSDTSERLPVFDRRAPGDQVPELSLRMPPYPDALGRSPRVAGFALLGVRVDAAGRVDERSIDQLAASNWEFMRVSINFVAGQRFAPGTRGGAAVGMRTLAQWTWNVGGGNEMMEFVVRR